eukprot:Pgem_evm1s17891
MRTAKVGGMGLFYAWAFEQEGNKSGHKFADQDVLVPFHIKMEQNKNKNEKTETKTEKGMCRGSGGRSCGRSCGGGGG